MTQRVILVQGWVSFRVTFGSLLAPFWYHFGVILESILAPFGFPGGGDPLPPPREGGRFGDPLWEHFGVTFGTPWGPLGRPWGTPRGQKGSQRLSEEGSGEGPREGPQNDPFSDPPWRVKTVLSLKREHRFQDFRGVPFGPHFGSILEPLWDPGGLLFSPRGPKGGTEGVPKGVPKRGPFLTPPFEPKGTQNGRNPAAILF